MTGAREFHPRALPEPYVSLSTHTAPITQPPTETLHSARRDQVVAKRFSESTQCRSSEVLCFTDRRRETCAHQGLPRVPAGVREIDHACADRSIRYRISDDLH